MKRLTQAMLLIVLVATFAISCKKENQIQYTLYSELVFNPNLSMHQDSMPSAFFDEMQKGGWELVNAQWVKRNIIGNVSLKTHEGITTTDANGLFAVNPEHVNHISIVYATDSGTLTIPITSVDKKTKKVFLSNSVAEWIDGIEGKTQHSHDTITLRGGPMGDPRCLDYNGIFSDGGNYGKTNWRAYVNFIGSDCDLAVGLGYCFLEHLYAGCYQNNGGRLCSAILGPKHPSYYHKHP